MDYEQLYYDSLYKIKKLEKRIKLLEEERDVYKSLIGNRNNRKIIAHDLIRYFEKKRCKSE